MSSELFAPDNYTNPPEKPSFDALPLQQWPEQINPASQRGNLHLVTNDLIEPGPQYKLGDPNQVIASHRESFMDLYRNNQVVIVEGETGSGKTTQIPLYLLEEYISTDSQKRLLVSSPRIAPTRETQAWLQKSVGPDLVHLIGRLTGTAKDSDCHPDAKIIFITEHLLYKHIVRDRLEPYDDVMLDEVHERTKPMVALMGFVKESLSEFPERHVIVGSATFDIEKHRKYYANPDTSDSAPALSIPGRRYPIDFQISERSVAEEARDLITQGKHVIVFEPGITRMQTTASKMAYIKKQGEGDKKDQVIHLLYGDQSPLEQREALTPEINHHIVANKVGETSLTPDGKDAVVSSGLSNVGGYNQGVRILETVHSSKSAIKQQGGRVGRTRDGIHILAQPDDAPPIDYEDRPEYDPSEIQSGSVASFAAELLAIGKRLEELPLIDSPTEENLRHDYKLLRRLGATAVVNNVEVLTNIGRQMIDLPVDMPFARVIVEARATRNGESLSTEAVRIQACAIAAIEQVNGILEAWRNGKRREQFEQKQKGGLSTETKSDPLYELDAFVTLRNIQLELMTSDPDNATLVFERILRRKDIKLNPYYKALRTFEELCRRENLDTDRLAKPTPNERVRLVECLITGAEELFVQKNAFWHRDIRGSISRQLGMRSTIDPARAQLVIGTAFNIRGMTDEGKYESQYITSGTVVHTEQLLANAAHRISRRHVGFGITADRELKERQALYFDDSLQFDVVAEELSPTVSTREFLIRAMMLGARIPKVDNNKKEVLVPISVPTPNAQRAMQNWHIAQDIEHRTSHKLAVDERYRSFVNKVIRESIEQVPLNVTDLNELDDFIPNVSPYRLVRPTRQKHIRTILENAPDYMSIVIDDAEEELEITYKNGVAHVSIPSYLKFVLKREHFAELEEKHPVKLKINGGQYKGIGAAFEALEKKYQEYLKRQARRDAETRLQTVGVTLVSKQQRTKNNEIAALNTEPENASHRPWAQRRQRGKAQDARRQRRIDRRRARSNNWAMALAEEI